MEEFPLPEHITALNYDELDALLDGAINAFDAMSRSSTVTTDDLVRLRELATGVESIRAEKAERIEAAQQAAAEIEALAATVRGEEGEEAASAEEVTEPVAVEPEPVKETLTAAAVLKGRSLDLSRVRAHQPRVLPADPSPRPEITASVDVPGYQPGQALDMAGVTEGIIRRPNALKTAGGGVGMTASYRLPFPEQLIVNDSSSGTEGTRAVVLAGDQARLNGGDLVAAGGWCAPSETVYELTGMSCPEMLWDLPEIQLARGGLRYFPMPSLDVAAMTWVHTEADDIAGTEKSCFRIPCPDPVEVRCDAIGACLESGILTQRHFPELVAYYQSLAMVAHEIRIKQELFTEAVAASTAVTIAATFGAFSAIFAAIALQAADMTEKLSVCANINIEVVLPWWSCNLFLADIARHNGVPLSDQHPRHHQRVRRAGHLRPVGARPEPVRTDRHRRPHPGDGLAVDHPVPDLSGRNVRGRTRRRDQPGRHPRQYEVLGERLHRLVHGGMLRADRPEQRGPRRHRAGLPRRPHR